MIDREDAPEQARPESRPVLELELWHFDVAVAAFGLCSLAMGLGLT